MKVKELQKTVNVAWSPVEQNPIMLAAGTAAQQLDASFSTSAALELYSINLSDPSYDLELVGSQASAHRFHKVLWSPFDYGANHPNGLIVGGCEGGVTQVYSVAKLLAGENALLAQQEKHNGAVRSMDYNPFQNNLLASGASESEIIIWDLNKTTVPMSPGQKVQPYEDVQGLSWNRQVQHILASVFSSRCVIWDLRKSEPIIKLSDSQSRIRWRAGQWHPEVATQLWLASEEDQAPSVQLWDLRYATAPAKTFHIHQRGVLGLTWCPKDFDLVASCGKDNKIYCWNQNSDDPNGEILSELATTNQWNFDVAWCPRNPALIAGSSFDGNVTIYSIFGGARQQVQTVNKIADSFPGMETMGHEPVPQANAQSQPTCADLKRAPKWLKRPAGACFGFGGKLVTFNGNSRSVIVNQVITDPELVERSNRLEQVLAEGNFSEYCRQKADQTNDQHSRFLWYFLKANFEEDPRNEMLNLLGYHKEDMMNKYKKYTDSGKQEETGQNSVEELVDKMSRTLDNNALFDAIAAGNKLLAEQKPSTETEGEINDSKKVEVPYRIRTGQDNEGLICEALLTGNLEAAVELCMDAGKTTEALILAMNGGSELLARVQYRYLKNSESYLSNIISALVTEDWSGVVSQCTIDSWKEALVAALTHCNNQLPLLCERLGERLQMEASGDAELARNAILCYICAGNTERLVEAWNLQKSDSTSYDFVNGEPDKNNNSNRDLQELVEVAMLLQKALEKQGKATNVTGKLAELLSQYASLLAAQGSLNSALSYVGNSTDTEMEELRERLYYALGHKSITPVQQSGYTIGHRGSVSNQPAPPFNPMFPTIGQAAKIKNWQAANNSPIPAPAPVPTIPQPINQPSWNTTPFQGSLAPQQPSTLTPFNQMAPPITTAPLTSKPPMGPPPSADIAQPPRPASVSSQTGSTTLGRAKYLLDPSVTSGPSYGQTPANLYNQNNIQSATNYQFNQFPNQPINQQPQPSLLNPAQPPQQMGNFKPFTPAPLVQPGVPSYLPGVPPLDVSQPPMMNAGYPGAQQTAATAPPPPLSNIQKNPTPPPGWNDPPALKGAPRAQFNEQCEMSAVHAGTRRWRKIIDSHEKQPDRSSPQPKADMSSVAPIMSPLPGTFPIQTQNGYPDTNSNYIGGQYPPTGAPGGMPPTIFNPASVPTAGQPQQQTPGAINYQNFQQNLQYQQQQPQSAQSPANSYNNNFRQQPPSQPAQQIPFVSEPPKQKLPIPEEYIYLQTVFEELKKQCINAAGNPQTKRKLEDVSKRLEVLYDLLREHKLSQNTLAALSQLVQLIQAGDYANGIGLHTQMVSGHDFAQIAAFMPGIKVLLQSAMQLQVYLR
ncbi:protein transport protein Sec31A isoform X2 [Toxorhynchites rutilus septentrionalis]|uniref:protein transport protein Sec31A isoform X2 n=1 Tax=Toxorhynchites rutilus septentrionalis TaxID=329112 RepID=UPI00247ABD04|nr:protein transport protein Sec31A isoform X2 [Toxorhynchites rutilus septentrionalis]